MHGNYFTAALIIFYVTKGSAHIHYVEGNHITILENDIIAKVIDKNIVSENNLIEV